jgi:hypothetical protein
MMDRVEIKSYSELQCHFFSLNALNMRLDRLPQQPCETCAFLPLNPIYVSSFYRP